MKNDLNFLIVEDDPIQRLRLEFEISESLITNVYYARDGEEGYKSIIDEEIDVILCDLNMPNVDGIQFISNVAKINTNIILIIVTTIEEELCELTLSVCEILGFKKCALVRKKDISRDLTVVTERLLREFVNETVEKSIDKKNLTLEQVKNFLENDEVVNFYQPKVDFQTSKVKSVEALVRIISDKFGVISPVRFINVIENDELINVLFFVVLKNSLHDIKTLPDDVNLSVNITQKNISYPNICNVILSLCHEYSFDTKRLTLEITENQAYENSPQVWSELIRLRMNGVKLSIDDFGTGYASLEKLIELPFTEMKIDRKFVNDISNSKRKQTVLEFMCSLAKSLSMNTVAEGVEDHGTWSLLKDLGFDECQGFFIAKPMRLNELHTKLDIDGYLK
ncbi:EAL domain-containing response regulator [Vibrio tasmaniensis]|uniref:EAL domain-containing response regulator n=1 Tax=Vibrio tasmaniensis TaxID=212663 RepID=UPI00107F89D7|nr:EAL domain-containing response regulator [Vibrio tasmaniensis]